MTTLCQFVKMYASRGGNRNEEREFEQAVGNVNPDTARLSAQNYFLGGGMVRNKPHSLKLILLLRTDIGLGKFT